MINTVCIILVTIISFGACAQNKINGYYISFDCCFSKDSLHVFNKSGKVIYRTELNTNPMSGICDSGFLLLPYTREVRSVIFGFNGKTNMRVKLKRTNKIKHLIFFKVKENFDYEIRDKIGFTE